MLHSWLKKLGQLEKVWDVIDFLSSRHARVRFEEFIASWCHSDVGCGEISHEWVFQSNVPQLFCGHVQQSKAMQFRVIFISVGLLVFSKSSIPEMLADGIGIWVLRKGHFAFNSGCIPLITRKLFVILMYSFKNCNIANSFKLHVALIRHMVLIYFDLIRFKIHGPVDLQSRTISAREDSSPSELFQCNFLS